MLVWGGLCPARAAWMSRASRAKAHFTCDICRGCVFEGLQHCLISLSRPWRSVNKYRRHDIIHTKETLTLVFEYLDRDLKQYMDDCGSVLHPQSFEVV